MESLKEKEKSIEDEDSDESWEYHHPVELLQDEGINFNDIKKLIYKILLIF